MNRDDKDLIEQVLSAWRPKGSDGGVRSLPQWHDLSEADRRRAFEETRVLRAMEAALDPEGLSTTARAVLDQIRSGGR